MSLSNEENLILDELVKNLLIHPFSGIEEEVQVIWDIDDEPSILEIFLSQEEERTNVETETAKAEEENVAEHEKEQSLRREDLAEIIKQESLKRADKHEAQAILMMTPEEILEKIRCKCQEIRDRNKNRQPSILEKDNKTVISGSEASLNRFGSRKSRLKERSKILTDPSTASEVPEKKIDCSEFLNIKDYAIYFIDHLLSEAEQKANDHKLEHSDFITSTEPSECVNIIGNLSDGLNEENISDIYSSLKIEEFTPQYGHDFIMDTILTWNLQKAWTYCIDFLSENSDTCCEFYNYEVKWSLPTMSYPIPQVTASVFFTVEVSRVKGGRCPVNVYYNFETERYKFTLEDDIQHEVFLDSIIKNKLEFFKSLRF